MKSERGFQGGATIQFAAHNTTQTKSKIYTSAKYITTKTMSIEPQAFNAKMSPSSEATSSNLAVAKCLNEMDAWRCRCVSSTPCTLGQGRCWSSTQCAPGLICGQNNCREFDLRAPLTADCCFVPNFKHLTNLPTQPQNKFSLR